MNYLLAFAILVGWLICGEDLMRRAHDLALDANDLLQKANAAAEKDFP